eukprot:gnl/MRDRNA2_/MRDRNA2_87731_c0_seq1.p1 gnl/MRDRNA2_/MRDRNA2_87731_c0~~gnl/MRDRNA2_/MRDRNA2_87731_c0_seq1.p1  ORF type:complete len:175 (+),score=27.25 gnl/MRDRNA2_/MRDRNA2_87731_c0_seq1:73-525(+)
MASVLIIAITLLAHSADAALFRKHSKDVAKLDITKGQFAVVLDKDMRTQMLVQIREKASQPIKDPCGSITCGALSCPAGFTETTFEGHCCPYCYNPDIKVESLVKGAEGTHGGKPSTFCQDVWCFPTMCTKPETAPTTTNGACCPLCPAL